MARYRVLKYNSWFYPQKFFGIWKIGVWRHIVERKVDDHWFYDEIIKFAYKDEAVAYIAQAFLTKEPSPEVVWEKNA